MFSDRLKALREHYNITQKQLAEEVGLSVDSIAGWENETEPLPKLSVFFRLTRYFNVSLDYILGFTDVPGHCLPPLPIDEKSGLPILPVDYSKPHTFPIPENDSSAASAVPVKLLRQLCQLRENELVLVEEYINKLLHDRGDVYVFFT